MKQSNSWNYKIYSLVTLVFANVISKVYILIGTSLVLFVFNPSDVVTYGIFFSLTVITTELFTLRINASQARILFEDKFSKNIVLKGSLIFSLLSFSFFYFVFLLFFKQLLHDNNILIMFYFFSFFKIINNFYSLNSKIFGQHFYYLCYSIAELLIFIVGFIFIYTYSGVSFFNFICISILSLSLCSFYYIWQNIFLVKKIKNIFKKRIIRYFAFHSLLITLYSLINFIIIHHSRIFGKYFIELNDYSQYIKITTVLFLISMFSKLFFENFRPELSYLNSAKNIDINSIKKTNTIVRNIFYNSLIFITLIYFALLIMLFTFDYKFISTRTLTFCYFYSLIDIYLTSRLTRLVYQGKWIKLILSYIPTSLLSVLLSFYLYSFMGIDGLIVSSIILFTLIYFTSLIVDNK